MIERRLFGLRRRGVALAGAFAFCIVAGISTNAFAADTLLDWSTATAVDLETGASVETRDGITVTTTGALTGGRTADTLAVQPATTANGFTGFITTNMNANTDNESVSNDVTFTFSEPVYGLSFTAADIDSSNTASSSFTDLFTFNSDGGLPTAATTGTNVTYTLATGRAISNQITNCQAANQALCLVTVTFANPLTTATIRHVAAGVIGVAGPTNSTFQVSHIRDLRFNTAPDATNNTASTFVGITASGNVVTDDDGFGVDSDRQDGASVLVNQISHPTGGTSAVGPAGTTLTLANGATLTIAQDGSYTFNPNGAYAGLALGASTTETFTYRIEDLEGLFNTNGDTPNPDSVATLVVTISNTTASSLTLTKVVDQSSITAPGTLNYTMTVTNTGNTVLTSPTLNDTLTQSGSPLTLTSGPTGPTGDAGTLGVLDVGEIWTYTATYNATTANIDDGGNILNVATFDTAETAPETSSASTTTPGPTFACAGDNFPGNSISGASGSTICSTTGATAEAGEPNPIGGDVESIWYTWTAPLTGTADFNTCDVGVGKTDYDTHLGVYTGNAVNALAVVVENDDDPGCANFSSRVTFAAVAGTTYRIAVDGYLNNDGNFKLDWSMVVPSAAITKTVDKTSVSTTDMLNYTIIVDNNGTQALNAPVLNDVVSQNGATRQSVSGVTLHSGDTDLDGILDTDETWVYTVSYSVTATDLADGNDLLNTASFTSTETPTAITATATTTIDEADLSLAKTVSPGSLVAGGPVTFTLTLTNGGPATSIGVTVTDVVPAGFSVTGTSTVSGSASNTGNTVTWTPADLANGTSATLDITATAITAGPYTNAAEVTASGLPDPDSTPNDSTGDDYATVGVTIIAAAPSTSIAKTAALVKAPGNSGADAEAGDTINYTFIVTNTGNTVLTDVDVDDNDTTHSGSGPLPNPLEDPTIVTDAAPTGDSTDVTPGNGIWSQLGPGDVIRFTTSYTVTQEDVDAQ